MFKVDEKRLRELVDGTNFSQTKIAEILGVTPVTLVAACKRYGVDTDWVERHISKKRRNDIPWDDVMMKRSAGESYERIARDYACSATTIKRGIERYRKTNGLPPEADDTPRPVL